MCSSFEMVWLDKDGSCSAAFLYSRDEKLDEQEEEETVVLDDSVEFLCFSFTTFFRFLSCNCKLHIRNPSLSI